MPMPKVGKRNQGVSSPVATLMPKQPSDTAAQLLDDAGLTGVADRQVVSPGARGPVEVAAGPVEPVELPLNPAIPRVRGPAGRGGGAGRGLREAAAPWSHGPAALCGGAAVGPPAQSGRLIPGDRP